MQTDAGTQINSRSTVAHRAILAPASVARQRAVDRLPYVPGKTRTELATPAPNGERHEQAKRIIISLIGNGLSADAVFTQVRGMYDASYTDAEIINQIQWATRQNFTPSKPRFTSQRIQSKSAPVKPVDPAVAIGKFLAGDITNEIDLYHVSPWPPLDDWRVDSIMFLAGMFHAGELVNIVTDHIVNDHGKANPTGYGLTLERDAMMRHLRDKGTPQSKAGAWLRMNPVDGKGVADANVTACRFALLEIDTVPVDKQISVFAKLPLPINAIYLSGGKSVHALVRVDAPDAARYRATVAEMLDVLKPLGVDQGNKNPSRLSRLPGAQRDIGAQGDGQQRLLYLAPDRRDSNPIFKVNQ